MDYTPKDIILGNPKLIAKKKKEDAEKVVKVNGTSNVLLSGKKINDEDELPKLDKVGLDMGKIIMQARLAKKNQRLTQADLAKQLNITPDIIRDHENGSAPRNGELLNRIGKILGVKLTGKNI
jgi:ribosome-binding protein aMBF1 (putative translation factor)